MLAGGAGFSLPGIADVGQTAGNPAGSEIFAQTCDERAEAARKPELHDPCQSETLIVLVERIIPGSTIAQVNGFIDWLLTVGNLDALRTFVET